MKLTIPLFTIVHKQIGGTESAIYNLVSGLADIGCEVEIVYSDSGKLSPDFMSWAEREISTRKTRRIFGKSKNSRFLEENFYNPPRGGEAWVLYPNYFMPITFGKRSNVAVLLHDIQYKALPDLHSWRRKFWLNIYLPYMFKKSTIVLLISHSELSLVRKHFGEAAASKCRVIFNAVDWSRYESSGRNELASSLSKERYIFSVFHPFPHKNLETLLRAFNIVSREFPEVKLYLAGENSEKNKDLVSEFVSADISGRVEFLGYISDSSLGEYYRNAHLVALPSLYEGFGMPAVEAIGLGTPAILSDINAFREVTCSSATYVSAKDHNAWAAEIRNHLSEHKKDVTSLASILRQKFSPATVAEGLVDELSRHQAG